MPKRESASGRSQPVFVVRLNDKTRELTSPGAAIQLTLGWLTQNATVDGEGILDSYVVSKDGPYITAYFDQDGAGKAQNSCHLYPKDGRDALILAGPVVIACFGAESQTEATVQTAQVLSVIEEQPTGPVILPTWPTVQ